MRLATAIPRPQLPSSPLASLALLLLGTVMVAGLFAAARGPGLRFATPTEPSAFADARPLTVRILPGGSAEVDGVPVAREGLAAAIGEGLRGRSGPAALLLISPDATYGDMVAAYGAVASVPNVQVVMPTRAWVGAKATP
jgi:biopolymer transport protein ExbD